MWPGDRRWMLLIHAGTTKRTEAESQVPPEDAQRTRRHCITQEKSGRGTIVTVVVSVVVNVMSAGWDVRETRDGNFFPP